MVEFYDLYISKLHDFLSLKMFSNSLYGYIFSLILFFVILKILYYFKNTALKKIEKIAQKTETKLDDVFINLIKNIKWHEYQILSVYLATKNLIMPAIVSNSIKYLLIITITYRTVASLDEILNFWLSEISGTDYEKSIKTLRVIFKVIIWIIAVLFLLHNFGVKVGALLTGLGIGGVAVAFASQTILGDIFNFFVIILDKPFKIGDFILLPSQNLSGTVEEIGLKSVKIRTLRGELLIITNSKIMSEMIQNFSTMKERRVVFNTQVIYGTPIEKIKIIPEIIKKSVEKLNNTRFDRSNLSVFNNYSIDFETVYYITSPDYALYMQTHEKLLHNIAEEFKKENIEFAYPTQKIYINK